jgi:site-specific recombinase XerD
MSLQDAIQWFLTDLKNANRSPQTIRSYRTDLQQMTAHCPPVLANLTTDHLRAFFADHAHLKLTTRARKQTSVASFLQWAHRQRLIDDNPLLRLDRIRADETLITPPSRRQIETILNQIPPTQLRDHLLFRLIFETGLRIGEALSIYIEDIDLTFDDEHVTVNGKGRRQRTVLIDDPGLVTLLKQYLKQYPYRYGPLFRAHKNYRGGALRYQSAQEKWTKYCTQAGIRCTLHALRHAHATELVNDGVSLATIRKRLGHKHIQTTLRYAQQSDDAADAEIRAWRRRRQR